MMHDEQNFTFDVSYLAGNRPLAGHVMCTRDVFWCIFFTLFYFCAVRSLSSSQVNYMPQLKKKNILIFEYVLLHFYSIFFTFLFFF